MIPGCSEVAQFNSTGNRAFCREQDLSFYEGKGDYSSSSIIHVTASFQTFLLVKVILF